MKAGDETKVTGVRNIPSNGASDPLPSRARDPLPSGASDLLPSRARVLIVLTGSLGDVARGIVVPTLLKESRSDLHITWLVEDRWSEVVQLCPAVDHLLEYHRRDKRWGIDRLISELREVEPFYCALDLQRHFKSGCFTRLSGAKKRVGFARKDAKEGNWLFQTEYIQECDFHRSKVFHYKAFVEHLLNESPESRSPRFAIDKKIALTAVERLLSRLDDNTQELFAEVSKSNRSLITLALGSSWESKDWPSSGYSQLIRHLLEEDELCIVLVGDSSQKELGERLQSHNTKRVVNLAGATTLTELAGILSLSSASAGPDTGVGHLASLMETPYVGLFGPTDARRVAPFGSEHRILTSYVPCRPCHRRVCPGLKNACMRLISPNEVREEVLQVLR